MGKPLAENVHMINPSLGNVWINHLHFYQVPLSKLFVDAVPFDKKLKGEFTADKKQFLYDGRVYCTIRDEHGWTSCLVKLTPEFEAWILAHTFGYIHLELVQQSRWNPQTRTSRFADTYLITVEESEIIGCRWIDYKPKAEIEAFFRNSLLQTTARS